MNRQVHGGGQIRGFQGLEGGVNKELLINGYRVSIWGDEKALEIDSDDGCTML